MRSNRRPLYLTFALGLLAAMFPATAVSAASAKSASVSVRVAGCDVSEDDDALAEELGFTYLADALEGPCKITASLKPRIPKRQLVLQRFDEESEAWVTVAKKNSSRTGTSAFTLTAESEETCFDFDVVTYRVAAPKAGKARAAYSSSFTVALVSDPDSPACTEAPTDDGDPADDGDL